MGYITPLSSTSEINRPHTLLTKNYRINLSIIIVKHFNTSYWPSPSMNDMDLFYLLSKYHNFTRK